MRQLTEWDTQDDLHLKLSSVLQLCAVNTISERLFPNLNTLTLWPPTYKFIPFIPSLLSPRTTVIDMTFRQHDFPILMVASMMTTFSTLCPNLQSVFLLPLPRDPMIVTAVSRMVLANNRNTLRNFTVDSPLTEEAREVVYRLPALCQLSLVIEKDTPLPSAVLPNLTRLVIKYDHESDWLGVFRGATFGKLEAVRFNCKSERIGDFLEAFEKVALAASVQDTLSEFYLLISYSWIPHYPSVLPFTQMKDLVIDFPCGHQCSSAIDDGIITDIARAMPRLKTLQLGGLPCQASTGVTAKGLTVLAHHCPDLSSLCIHFQAASLGDPLTVAEMVYNVGSATLRRNYALKTSEVGETPVSEESVPFIALALSCIFPRLDYIDDVHRSWEKVMDSIRTSRQGADYSGEEYALSFRGFGDTSQQPHST